MAHDRIKPGKIGKVDKIQYKSRIKQEEFIMKKSNFIALILGTIGTVFFALGMCMALIAEWEMRQQGTICSVVGLVVLLADLLIWRRMKGKEPIHISGKTLGITALSVFGVLLGVGMSLCIVFGYMVQGIVIGLLGILALLCLIPLSKGLK